MVVGILLSTFAAAPALADGPTVPNQDLTISVSLTDWGVSQAVMQGIVDQQKDSGLRLSDVVRRMVQEYPPDAPADDLLGRTDWPSFDGTWAVTSDTLSLTIPGSEVQANANGWQILVAAILAPVLGYLARGVCLMYSLAPTICTPIGGAVAGFVGSFTLAAFDKTLNEPLSWAKIIAATVMGALGGYAWEKWGSPFFKNQGPGILTAIGNFFRRVKSFIWWLGSWGDPLVAAGDFADNIGIELGNAVDFVTAHPRYPGLLTCDVYDQGGTPCVSAHSTIRALFAGYYGPLYQVQRSSDRALADIRPVAVGGYADAAAQDAFCANTGCVITKVYDQSPEWNDLGIEGAGSAGGADHGADAAALPVTIGGHKVYGIYVGGQTGYRDNHTYGIAVRGQPEGMYMVASGTHVNNGCCFDYGNAETNTGDNGDAHMDTLNLSTTCYFGPCSGSGPWIEADLENGLFMGGDGSNLANTGISANFVTGVLKNNGQTTYALKGANAQSGGLTTYWNGGLPTIRNRDYIPMKQEGAIVLGTGGDNSNSSVGSFFEGAMTAGYPTDAAENAVQSNIVAAGYDGNSGGTAASAPPSAAGQAVIHDGYSSVYTVNSANGHLQETYLPKMGDPWSTQDLSAKYGTPPVASGTKPVTLTHDGYTSVFTVDAGSGHLQETYLPKMGDPWSTQDLSAKYGTPQVQAGTSPVAVVHTGYTSVYTVDANHHLQETYLPKMGDPWHSQDLSANYGAPPTTVTPTTLVHDGYTSVWTVDEANSHLQETYLPKMGDPWSTQDLSAKYGTPWAAPGTQPEAMVHTGYTSVYTIDGASDHLQETYLPRMGDPWSTQDLSAKYGTPPTTDTPIVLLHPNESGAVTWSSVYTIDQFNLHLQETYLPAIGNPWTSQDLSAKYGTPPVSAAPVPTAGWSINHDGYTSTYTVNKADNHLQETYLTAMGQPWATQDLSAKYGTPAVMGGAAAVTLVHDGYTSAYTVDASNGHLRETYLPKMGDPWHAQDLSAQFGTPASRTTPAAVVHAGYTSVYTVDTGNGHLWETYLSAIGQPWVSQDLSAKYGTAPVMAGTSPVAIVHSGWTSVYTVDAGSGHLRETYLPAIGDPWTTQDLSANYGTPATNTTPGALVHDGYTSVYTVDAGSNHLQETYLPAMGDPWTTQDLSAKYGTPAVTPGMAPVGLYHTGYASVYTVDQSSLHVQETYLPAISDAWSTQDLTAKYGTPAANQPPSALVHADTSGGLTWTSLFTVNISNQHLQETYLPTMGDPWTTQDLTDKYGTPPV
jgi:hypothetical protein